MIEEEIEWDEIAFEVPLVPDLWMIVFKHLVKPRPKPLSRPSRCALRQPDLCNLALVCKVSSTEVDKATIRNTRTKLISSQLFSHLSRRLLYTQIHTDDLPLMLREISRPIMQSRFAYTTKLFIEYPEMGRDITYDQLLGLGKDSWKSVAREVLDKEEYMVQQCKAEGDKLAVALNAVCKAGIKLCFPRLEVVSVSSIYGVEYDLWDRFELARLRPGYIMTTYRCAEVFDRFLAGSNVQHLCIRDPQGPLCISPITTAILTKHFYNRTLHFNHDIRRFPIPSGAHVKLVSDTCPDGNFQFCLMRMGQQVQLAVTVRNFNPMLVAANIDVYCSTDVGTPSGYHLQSHEIDISEVMTEGYGSILSKDDQREIASKAGGVIQAILRKGSRKKDIVRFHPSEDIEVCAACGSGRPI